MNYDELLKIIKELKIGQKKKIYSYNNIDISVLRPEKKFKNYDIDKNFQIFLKEGNREFRPNHLRVIMDLNLRTRSRPDLKEKLLIIFDNIFYGNDPLKELKEIKSEEFEHSLNPIEIIAILHQLLLIEQDYNYNKESKFEPKTLFLQGWTRSFG